MNILEKLAKVANDLDIKGFYDEASIVDQIIKIAIKKDDPGFEEFIRWQGIRTRRLREERSGADVAQINQLEKEEAEAKTAYEDARSRMAPGRGAGGLPYVPMPEPGVAVKTRPRRTKQPRVYMFQNKYNRLLKQLEKLGLDVSGFGPPLVEDALWGPKTARARGLWPRLQRMLQLEVTPKTEIPGIPAPKPGQLFPPAVPQPWIGR